MNCSPTITAEEFKTIHNGLCELRSVYESIHDVVREPISDKLARAIREIEKGLASAYEKDNEAFDRKSNHYNDIATELDLKSVWSIYEVDNLSDRHPFEGAERLVYRDHWGEKPVSCIINGSAYAALYVAANACIRDSGDDHHIFIENFSVDPDDSRTLVLQTGS